MLYPVYLADAHLPLHHGVQVNQLNQLIELTRSELKRDDRQRIMSLITMDAHARDIVLMLIRDSVTDKVSLLAFGPFVLELSLHHDLLLRYRTLKLRFDIHVPCAS